MLVSRTMIITWEPERGSEIERTLLPEVYARIKNGRIKSFSHDKIHQRVLALIPAGKPKPTLLEVKAWVTSMEAKHLAMDLREEEEEKEEEEKEEEESSSTTVARSTTTPSSSTPIIIQNLTIKCSTLVVGASSQQLQQLCGKVTDLTINDK